MALVPIDGRLQKEYRDALLVPDAPQMIETKNEIVPVVIVNSEVAPAKVETVKTGVLLNKETQATPSGTGNIAIDITVPTGKVYTLLAVEMATSSLVGTITAHSLGIVQSGNGLFIYRDTTGTDISYCLPTEIKVPSGVIIRFRWSLSAYTSGNVTARYLFLESDA